MLASFLPAIAKLIVAQAVPDETLAAAIPRNPRGVVNVSYRACPFVVVCHTEALRVSAISPFSCGSPKIFC